MAFKVIECIRKFKRTQEGFFNSYPQLAFLIKMAVSYITCIFIVKLLTFLSSPSTGWVQQNSPPNKLPLIFSNDSSVIDVSDGNIDLVQELASRKLVTIVMLYARWCPQSKLVAKQLEHVADVFKEEREEEVSIVAVDCWIVGGKCKQVFQQVIFPSLLAYHSSYQFLYQQGVREDELTYFTRQLVRPLLHISSLEHFRETLDTFGAAFVGSFDFSVYNPKGFIHYYHACIRYRAEVSLNAPPCGIITSPMLSEDLELARSSLTFISIYSGYTMYTASLIAKDMHKWMSEMLNERYSYVQYLTPAMDRPYNMADTLTLILFIPLNYSSSNYITDLQEFNRAAERYTSSLVSDACTTLNHLLPVNCSTVKQQTTSSCANVDRETVLLMSNVTSASHRNCSPVSKDKTKVYFQLEWQCFNLNVTFFYADSLRNADLLRSLGYRSFAKGGSALVLIDFVSELKFVRDLSEVNQNNIFQFISDVRKGRTQSLLKSALPPKAPCLTSGSLHSACIMEITTETFHQNVIQSNKDVLLIYYAKWCAGCTGLWPIIYELGEKLRSSHQLQFARIDADENELFACHKVEKYPQLILYPGERKSPVLFPQDKLITVNNLILFLTKFVSHPINATPPSEIVRDDLTLGVWSHEGWRQWSLSQDEIAELKELNRVMTLKLKVLEDDLSEDYLNKQYQSLQDQLSKPHWKSNENPKSHQVYLADTHHSRGPSKFDRMKQASRKTEDSEDDWDEYDIEVIVEEDDMSEIDIQLEGRMQDDAGLVFQVSSNGKEGEQQEEDGEYREKRKNFMSDDAGLAIQKPSGSDAASNSHMDKHTGDDISGVL